jgi:hypothetical protein
LRYEYKYLVPLDELTAVRMATMPFVKLDEHGEVQRGQYTVRSIYFDTLHLENYVEKVEGIRDRRKLRIRGYDREGPDTRVVLEIKRREGLPLAKHRAPVLYRDLAALLTTGDINRYVPLSSRMPNARIDARRFLYHMHRSGMRPVINVVYEREAFVGRFDPGVRVTFDKNLRSTLFPRIDGLFDDSETRFVFRSHFIMEVKFFGTVMPVWARSLIQRMDRRWQALSKYALCLQSHSVHPEGLNVAGMAQSLTAIRTGVFQRTQALAPLSHDVTTRSHV